ncbi:AbrB/MazE/SpoVT family DNA-binding domain-containing protein [Actinopolyspora alba]|uniref:AbrB/MazE/SpoVT family DNA-binding domain-containing protein n=1 Tax=Actinopolyspora alba TaxID=673379 RepID=UPI000B81BDA5|nr:AbrB/MazE/SpoVT family DNA-binding domain-containing protein [Actinopolyspora alba]
MTLPESVAKVLGVAEGDDLEFTIDESGTITVRGWTSIPTDQRWFWTSEWQAGEAEADQQIANGEVSRGFTSAAEMFVDIDNDDEDV